MHRTANMPSIWEEIISNLSGEDVAICLRVNRALRSAIGQCLLSSTRLREKTDAKAAACAFEKGILRSRVQVQFRQKYRTGKREEGTFFALDNVWYYRQNNQAKRFIVVRLSEDHERVLFRGSLRTSEGSEAIEKAFRVFPTGNSNRYFVSDSLCVGECCFCFCGHYTNAKLMEIGDQSAAFVPLPESSPHLELEKCGDAHNQVLDESEVHGPPCCVRYRLYNPRNEEAQGPSRRIIMSLLSSNGEFSKSVVVTQDNPDHFVNFHLPSNDEVKSHRSNF